MRKIKQILNGNEALFYKCPIDADGGILFDDGMLLIGNHDQDCCEHVYADWSALKDEAGLMDTDFSNLGIERRENRKNRTGIRICGSGRKFFVPCYNEQNGYYNDRLDIVLIDTNQLEEAHLDWWNGKHQYGMEYKIVRTWENVPTIDDYC